VILEGFKSQKWGEKIVKDCQISTLDFQCVTMSVDSCLKNLYFISGFVICIIKYTHMCIRHKVHPSVPSSIRPSVQSSICLVMVCLLRRGEETVEPAPTNAPVGRSVHGMGCISSSSLNHSTFFSFWPMSLFLAVCFLNPDLHTIFSLRIQYKRRGEERKKNRREDPDKLRVVGSRVRLIAIKWRNWHSEEIPLHN